MKKGSNLEVFLFSFFLWRLLFPSGATTTTTTTITTAQTGRPKCVYVGPAPVRPSPRHTGFPVQT